MSHTFAEESRSNTPVGDFKAWLVCLSAGLFFLYEFFQLNLFDVINQPLRDEFHLNATQLSWMSSTYLWANLLFLLPAGVILDRYSVRKVILAAMLICFVGTVGFALTSSFILAALFHSMAGISNAFCFLSCIVLVSRWFPPNRQALVVGTVVTMAFIGGMMAHTPLAQLNDWLGWRKALMVDAGIGAFIIVWIYCVVQDYPKGAVRPVAPQQAPVLPSFIKALSNAQNWFAGLYTSLLNLPIMVLCALWGATYLQVVYQLSEIESTSIVSLILLGSIVGCPIAGWLSDNQRRRKPMMFLGAFATLVCLTPLFLQLPLSNLALSVLFFCLGLFTSTQVISYPLIAESNPSEQTGAATGCASLIIMGGGGVGQILFGYLMAQHMPAGALDYSKSDFQFAMWMFPVAATVALVAVCLLKETYCKRLEKKEL